MTEAQEALQAFIKTRKELLLRAEYDLANFDYGVVIARRCDVKSRTNEENEAATLGLIHNQIGLAIRTICSKNLLNQMV